MSRVRLSWGGGGRLDLTSAVINPTLFDHHRESVDGAFQATMLVHLNDSPAFDGATKCSVHNEMVNINRMGAFQHRLSFDNQSPCGDSASAGLLHIKACLPFAAEMTAEWAFDPGGTTDDPRIAERALGVNS